MSFTYKQPQMYSPPAGSTFKTSSSKTSSTISKMNLLPLAGSLVSGIFGQIGQNRIINQQQAANYAAFQQNKQLAQYQNQLNIEQWERANNYNLPINQIKRLREAGLSPSLMYGNGASGLTAVTSPSMSAGTPINPVDMSLGGRRQTIGDAIQTTLNNSMQSAQIELLKAQADKTKSETKGIDISNDVNEKLLFAKTQAEVEQILSGTGLNKKQIELISANIEKFKKECEVFDATIQEKFANIDNMTFHQFLDMLNYELDKNLNEATIKQIEAQTSLTNAEIRQIRLTLPLVLRKYISEIKSIDANTEVAKEQRLLVYEQMCTEIVKRANIKKDTLLKNNEAAVAYEQWEALKAGNVKIKDQASRYSSMWGINKDIIFVIDTLFGGDLAGTLSKVLQLKDK